jgi:transposase
MKRRFQKPNRAQLHLLPHSVDAWISGQHLARFIWECVESFDLAAFYDSYGEEGAPPYDPQMMLSTLLYAWCTGTRSSRQIAKACQEQIAYRWLTGNILPDHCAFARFRSRHEQAINELFNQVLLLCHEVGLLRLGRVFLDGTKIKGNAALAASHTRKHIEKEIKKMLSEAKTADEEEDRKYGKDRGGDELPEDLRNPSGRLARLKQAREILAKKEAEEREAQQQLINDREQEERQTGKKKRGRKPADPQSVVNHERKANVTDPDSRIMKSKEGYLQGFNSQAVVTEEQIIIAAVVSQDENDVHQLEPMLQEVKERLEETGIEQIPDALAADAGYWREDLDIQTIEAQGTELFIATANRLKEEQAAREQPPPQGRIPANASKRDRMTRKLRTKAGKAVYKLRCQTVEPVFGQIKAVMGFRQFLRRGLDAVQSEWSLICLCSNLLKLHRAAFE